MQINVINKLVCVCQWEDRRAPISSASTSTMFSVALLLLLAAGSCEELSVDSHSQTHQRHWIFRWMMEIMLICVSTGVNSVSLIQSDSVVVQPGQSVTITCQVSGYSLTDSSYATGWIRQCEGKPMDWILHQWGGGSLVQNNALKNKFLQQHALLQAQWH